MEQTPETVVVTTPEPAPEAAPVETPEAPQPEMITVEEATRQASRIAAAARKESEEALASFRAEIAPKLTALETIEQEKVASEREKLTETERLRAEIAERDALIAAKDADIATRDTAISIASQQRRADQVNAAINAATPGLPAAQREVVARQFATVDEIDPAAVAAAATASQAEIVEFMKRVGLAAPIAIGSPGSPPADPNPDRTATLEELNARMDIGGPDGDKAAAELQRLLGVRA